MMKKQDSGGSPPSQSIESNTELSALTEKLQKKVNNVERNISETEDNLAKDQVLIHEGKEPVFMDYTRRKIQSTLELLKEVEEDAADAARLKHPETKTMEENLKQLRKRIMELNENHDKIYNSAPSERLPTINWEKIIKERQDSLSSKRFGTDLPTVEGQMEEHSVFHSEAEALGPLITDGDDKELIGDFQLKYNTLLATSAAWHQDLLSLRDYMLRCTIELYWMDQQVEDRINYDWSDANVDYPYRQRQYENTSRCLRSKEAAVTSLCDEGEKLIAANHPGKNVIKAHMEAVQADWQEFNSLLICEQSHLSNMEDYHKYYKDARDIQDLLNSLDAELNQKYIPAFKDMYQIEGLISGIDDLVGALERREERVRALERRGQQVCPLKFRREMLKMPLTVEALCDFVTDEGKITLGERYTLLATNGAKWDVKDLAECQLSVPAVCFVIPPTDPEAISLSEKISNQLKTLKQKVSSNKVVLLNQLEVLKKASSSVTGNKDQLCLQLMACLEKVTSDLEKQEKAIYNCLRPPLQQNHPLQDSSDRLHDLKDIGALIKKIVPEKNSKVHEADTFLTSNPKCTTASQLFTKVNKANNKYNKVNLLLKCAEDKLLNSNRLESSLQTVRALLSTYEMALTKDEIMHPDIGSLVRLQEDLFNISSELAFKRPTISEMQQSLSVAKWSCENLASQMQEHCPDINRQEAEAHKLAKRFENLVKQVNSRSKSLQRAKAAYNNYHNKYNDLKKWLSQLPNYEPQEMDDIRQVETKLKKQRSLLSDVARKECDLHDVLKNAQLYQQAVQDYESETEQFKSILDLDDGQVLWTRRAFESPGLKVKNEVSAIETKFTEVNAINKQRLQSLEYAQSLLCQQNIKSVRLVAPAEQLWRLKKNLENESDYRKHLAKEIQTIQNDIFLLENQTPQDTIVKKELIKKALDPQLVEEVCTIQQKLLQEQRVTQGLEKELEVLRFKLRILEKEMGEDAQQYIVKEVLCLEKDRKAEDELRRLKDELNELKRERAIKEMEIKEIQRELSVLTEVKAKEQEVEIEEEVIKVVSDPQLERKYQILLENKQKETVVRKQLEEELKLLQEKLKELEKEKTIAEQKFCIREILQVEKDIALQREVDNLRQQYEDEFVKHNSSKKEKADLERKISSLEKEKSKVIIQEKTHEIIWPDPKAEDEMAKLHHDLIEQKRRCGDAELQLQAVQDELKMLRNRSQIEYKEIIKEVVKYKTDPETEKELDKLRNEIVDKTYTTERYEKEIFKLKDEVQRLKNTKPPVQIKEIVNEVVQYHEDPTTKEEVETLKRKLAEEQKVCLELERTKSDNEEKIKLRQAHVSQVEVVQQEVVKLDEDPLLTSECQTLSQSISNEQKQKTALKVELFQLQCQTSDLDCQLEELKHERSAREKAETELQTLKVQLNDLETREKEAKEKAALKQNEGLQKDSEPDREHSILRKKLQEEQEKRMMLEKELDALKQCTMLTKVEVPEKVVHSEKVQIQRNPEAELDIERLRRNLEEESNRCCELNKQLNDINSRLCDVSLANKKSNEELEYIQNERYSLEMENQRLMNKIENLQAEIKITTRVTKHMTESSPLQNGENLELRLAAIQKELSDLRNTNDEKDQEIKKLQKNLSATRIKREHRESHLRRSVLVIDPGTSKEMTPEEAYSQGLINWAMFVHLQGQECDWEEITLIGPNGESSVLHDRKSGKQFSIEDALNAGTISNKQLQKYRNKEITIQEFGIMVSGNQI